MVGFIKEAGVWLWTKCPWFIKWPFIVIVGPNLTVNAIILFAWIQPMFNGQIHAVVMEYKEKRDVELKHERELQSVRDSAIINRLDIQSQQLSVIYAEMLRRQQ